MKLNKIIGTLTLIAMAATITGCSGSEFSLAESAKGDFTTDGITNGAATAEASGSDGSAAKKTTDDAKKAAGTDDKTDAALEALTPITGEKTEEFTADSAERGELDTYDAAFEDADTAKSADETEKKITVEAEEEGSEIDEPVNRMPEAGQLTAGEWNDNANWGFFTNLVNSGTITFPSFGIDPRYRTMVTVKSEDGSAVVNAKARLLGSDGSVIWSGVTDKNGCAYLFAANENEGLSIEIESRGKKQNVAIEAAQSNGQSSKTMASNEVQVTFAGEGSRYKKTDVMFILDTTGSMADEMMFLQSEFTAITNVIGTNDTKYSVNFYRDEGDEYVVRCNPFTDNVEELQKKLNAESADGGGDYPEAVDRILSETMYEKTWSEESVKIAFLIFDAPPHKNTESALLSAAKEAAAKGIRIVPIVSSDSDRDTELFARSLAITTGGTYVFLTDDSGVGNSHLEPIIGEYKVEKLYDIIIRVINDYKQ